MPGLSSKMDSKSLSDIIKTRPRPRTRFYPPTFSGRHNEVKWLAFIVLLDYYIVNPRQYIDTVTICSIAPLNSRSLLTLLKRWTNWGYISRIKRRGIFCYRLRKKARNYLSRYWAIAPIESYRKTITDWQDFNILIT